MIKVFVLVIIILPGLLMACGQTPETATVETASLSPSTATETAEPASTTPPDLPSISYEEMAAALWNKLPETLPDGYSKSQLDAGTASVTYQGQGKWTYSVQGSVRQIHNLPYRDYEKTPDYWVRNYSQSITTYELLLEANYYEKTGTFTIPGIKKSVEKTSTETIDETFIQARKLKINWLAGSTTGYGFSVEGSVKNIGILPLENVLFVVDGYDGLGEHVGTENITLSPAIIKVGESCKFVLSSTGFYLHGSDPKEGKVTLGRFTYRFLMASGQRIDVEEPD